MSGNLSEISLKSNDVSPAISTATTTQTSAFSFISDSGEHKQNKFVSIRCFFFVKIELAI
jgi:hypothetical protein